MQSLQVMVTASRNGKDPFKPPYRFRMLPQMAQESIDQAETLNQDWSRQVVLGSPATSNDYLDKVSPLTQHYTQGDLTASIDLVGLSNGLRHLYLERYDDPESYLPIKYQRFSYLREDGSLGGVTICYDPQYTKHYIAVVRYPQESSSYNEAEVSFFLPENIAHIVLTSEAFAQPYLKDTSNPQNVLKILQGRIANESVAKLIVYCLLHPSVMDSPDLSTDSSHQLGYEQKPTQALFKTQIIELNMANPKDVLCQAIIRQMEWRVKKALENLPPDERGDEKPINFTLNTALVILHIKAMRYAERYLKVMNLLQLNPSILPRELFNHFKDDFICFHEASTILEKKIDLIHKENEFERFVRVHKQRLSTNPLLGQIIEELKEKQFTQDQKTAHEHEDSEGEGTTDRESTGSGDSPR